MASFRDHGYDGASLAELSAATGLGKASLYHHFPGGKADMASEVIEHLEAGLERDLFAPLRATAPPQRKLDAMLDAIVAFYDGGRKACLLERMCASTDRKQFRRPLARVFAAWLEAIEALAVEAGLPVALARTRAEDFVVRVEGALVVSAGVGSTAVFERTMANLRAVTLAKPR
jgi:AcrR family transcriptional regulator